ncbi:GATA transcription factor 12-like [Ananas comosus]|uniref:GATA transcription factor 12-like n=1 Tax=Ananas comosus TaxID=4615 RepID=A0A6P5FIP9_ANACO|nr:GATA transcription factor 12-like [Ananas comosus]
MQLLLPFSHSSLSLSLSLSLFPLNPHENKNPQTHLSLSLSLSLSLFLSLVHMEMKGERNAPLSGEAPARSPPESESPAPSPASSVLGDFMPGPTVETGEDVSLEWLSIYVEQCLSSSTTFSNPHSLTTPPSSTTNNNNNNIKNNNNNNNIKNNNNNKNNKNPNSQTPQFCQETPQLPQNPIPVPAKSRTKRRRITTTPRSLLGPLGEARYEYDYDYDYDYGPLLLAPPDPPLLHQTQWLADSELLSFPKTNPLKEEDRSGSESKNPTPKGAEGDDDDDDDNEEEKKGKEEEEEEGGQQQLGGQGQGQGQQLRRCTHCLSHKTPQWRAGPLGPKTLCNACGVRFKSGRLLPEYRPAKSPTFVSYKHSNSHKKVMEMRMMAILSSQSN